MRLQTAHFTIFEDHKHKFRLSTVHSIPSFFLYFLSPYSPLTFPLPLFTDLILSTLCTNVKWLFQLSTRHNILPLENLEPLLYPYYFFSPRTMRMPLSFYPVPSLFRSLKNFVLGLYRVLYLLSYSLLKNFWRVISFPPTIYL